MSFFGLTPSGSSGGGFSDVTGALGFGSYQPPQKSAPPPAAYGYGGPGPTGGPGFDFATGPSTSSAVTAAQQATTDQQQPYAVPGTQASPLLGQLAVSAPSVQPSTGLNLNGKDRQGGFRIGT